MIDIINLTQQSSIYTSNAWLCRCGYKGQVCRTLIDTGCDPETLSILKEIETNTGEKPVDQVILTHNHYDHTRTLQKIKELYNPVVYASSAYVKGVDHVVKDGNVLAFGDLHLDIMAIPGHSSDSICIYCPEEEVLFSGDTPVFIWGTENTYEKSFLMGFEALARKKIGIIYPGHGELINHNTMSIIKHSLENIRKSRLI
jgi:glyoxylase-like metal-dependent hydrolase (beta-lactamase superfamily II)